jgi:hypothetical protein
MKCTADLEFDLAAGPWAGVCQGRRLTPDGSKLDLIVSGRPLQIASSKRSFGFANYLCMGFAGIAALAD